MSVQSVPDAAELHLLLRTILSSTENAERSGAESRLRAAFSGAASLPVLIGHVCDVAGAAPGTRQLAAVLLRRRVGALWPAVPEPLRASLSASLLAQLSCEPERAVRLAVAHAVARIARLEESWPGLATFIAAAAAEGCAATRELAMVVALGAASCVADEADCAGAVTALCGDATPVVRCAAFRAAGAFLSVGSQGVLRGFAPALVAPATEALAVDAVAADALELLEAVAARLRAKRHAPIVRAAAAACAQVLSDAARPVRVREMASEWLVSLATARPRFFAEEATLAPVVAACNGVMAEDGVIALAEAVSAEETEADGEIGGSSPCMVAARLLSTLAANIPSRAITAAIMPFVSRVADAPLSTGPFERKAAVLALACLAEGATVFLRRRLSFVVDFTGALLLDKESAVVREAAAFALAHFCIHLHPEILTQHARVFPMLIPLLHDTSDDVRRRAAGALAAVCEHIGDEVEPYVSAVLTAVVESAAGASLATQKELCGIIASIASTRCSSFLANAVPCLELIKPAMVMTEPEAMLLRAKATEAGGIIANAMGREALGPHLSFFVERISENLQTRRPELREETFGFMSNLCEVLRGDFLVFVDDAMGAALQSIQEDRAIYENRGVGGDDSPCLPGPVDRFSEKHILGGDGIGDDGEHSHDDDDDDDGEEVHVRVRTADVEEKCSAVYCIGVMAEVLLDQFGSTRIEQCWESLFQLDGHFHANVRSGAIVALAKLVMASHGALPVDKSANCDTLTPVTRSLLKSLVCDTIFTCIEEEDDKAVVSAACDAMELLFNFFGPQVVFGTLDDFVQYTVDLLEQRTLCQHNDDDDDDDSDADVSEEDALDYGGVNGTHEMKEKNQRVVLGTDHDDVLMDSVCDMIEAFAKAFGSSFAPYCDTLLPPLLLFAAVDRPDEDLVMSTGCIATILEAMGPSSAPFVDTAVNLALCLIEQSEEPAARANCAYLLRALVENCPERFAGGDAAAPLLRALWSLAGNAEELPAAVDNAVSATCSMVRCLPPEAVPHATVVPELLRRIPMRVDHTENANAVRTLVYLMSAQADFVRAHCGADVVRSSAAVLSSPAVEDKVKQFLVAEGLASFVGHSTEARQMLCTQLTPEEQTILHVYGCI